MNNAFDHMTILSFVGNLYSFLPSPVSFLLHYRVEISLLYLHYRHLILENCLFDHGPYCLQASHSFVQLISDMNVPMLARQLKATCKGLITFQFCCCSTFPELATAIEYRTEQTFLTNEDLCF